MGSGIYQIWNRMSAKRYIGSAVNIAKRWRDHLGDLRRGRHCNRHLQASFDKYGEASFGFSVLEYIEDASQLISREQHFFDTLSPEYNIAPIAGSQLGFQHTDEARKKMSEIWMGHPVSAKARARMSAAKSGERHPMYGKHHSKETRRKIGAALSGERHPNYGKHHSAETRAKISAGMSGQRNPNYGKHHSEERCREISEALKGRPCSEETRQKIGEASRNRSLESNRKISTAMSGKHNPMYGMNGKQNPMYGKHHSEETRNKISMTQKARWHRIHAENQDT